MLDNHLKNIDQFILKTGERLDDKDTYFEDTIDDEEVKKNHLPALIEELSDWQLKLQAENKQAVVLALQALDAAGKDEIITFIFSHLRPQGLKVTPTGIPSEEEQQHDFLWRHQKALPERGEIGILNRSYYEDVVSLLVHGSDGQIPMTHDSLEEEAAFRIKAINQFEDYLYESGFRVVKIFPRVSKEVQKKRLLDRMKDPEKNWEFSLSDLSDREKWDSFYNVYEKVLQETSTERNPWYVLPADNPWLTRYFAGRIVCDTLSEMNPDFPTFDGKEAQDIKEAIEKLEAE
jgi:PPK2 family polyphosphate:nucleotide phosphotransferase